MKSCELCKSSSSAMMYCESDQASLCWDCDAKVHSANFLVARHSRSLLCHVCRSLTPWKASGAKLWRTVSMCESCVDGCERVKEANIGANNEEIDGGYDGEIDGEDEYDEEDEDIGGDDEDVDNQVVPLSSTPPPPDANSSNSEESSSRFCNSGRAVSLNKLRENAADLYSNDNDHGCSSAHPENSLPWAPIYSEPVVVESLRPLKRQRTERTGTIDISDVDSIQMSNLRNNPGAVRRESSRMP